MREIKFRAWDKFDNAMYKVESIGFNCFQEITIITVYINDGLCLSYNKDHSINKHNINALELMQYTGLKDKNGVEIYEGDILNLFDTINEVREKVIIKWNNEEACYEVLQLNGNHYSFDFRCSITGCEVL